MIKSIFFFFSIILIFSCKSNSKTETIFSNDQPITIKLFDDGKIPDLNIEKKTFKLLPSQSTYHREVLCSEIFDTLTYVRLQATDKSLIGQISEVIFTGEEFIIHDRKTNKILRFSKDGIYLNQISSMGRGPREYTQVGSLECIGSGDEGDIYIGTYGSILHFKLNNIFIKSYPLIGERKEYILIDTSSIAVAQSIRSRGAKYRLITQDFKGDTLQTFKNHIKFEAPKDVVLSSKIISNFYRYNNQIYYQPQYSDTIFLINGAELIPKYIFDLGAFKMEEEWIFEKGLHSINEMHEYGFSQFNSSAIETEKFLFITATSLGRYSMKIDFIYNKEDNNTIAVKPIKLFKNNESKVGVLGYENDFDGGPPFTPQWFSDSYAIGMFEYINTTKKNPNTILRDKYLSKDMRNSLIDLINIHDEDDNPILIMGKYKTM